MNESKRIGLIAAFLAVIALFLIFGYVTMSGSYLGDGMMGGGMMGDGTVGRHGFGGYGWMWIPTIVTFGIGVFLGWLLFAKKR